METPRDALDHLEQRSRGDVIARVGVTCVLYCDARLDKLAPRVADVFEAFQAFVPKGALDSRWARAGWVKLTPRAVTAQLKELRENVDAEWEAISMFYGQGEPPGVVGTHAFEFAGHRPPGLSVLSMQWPLDVFDRIDVNELVDFLASAAERVPFWFGHAGLALRYNWTRDLVRSKPIPGLLGIDPGASENVHHRFVEWDRHKLEFVPIGRDRTLAVRWVNFLADELIERIGGATFRASLPSGIEARAVGDGLLLRTVEVPPVGEIAKGARDLGWMPDLARLLKPTRHKDEDARLDDVPSTPVPPWTPSGLGPARGIGASAPAPSKTKKAADKAGQRKESSGAWFARARELLDARDTFEGFLWLSLAADAGHPEAASWLETLEDQELVSPEEIIEGYLELARWFESGTHVAADAAARVRWLEAAAEAGSDEAERLLSNATRPEPAKKARSRKSRR